MILQALAGYYRRMAGETGTEVAPEGFEKKEIPFVIVLDLQGRFIGVEDTREGEGEKKRARVFTVPKGVKKTRIVAANLLWDTPAYVFGRPRPDPRKDMAKLRERAQGQFQAFQNTIRETFPQDHRDEGVAAVLRFLETRDFAQLFAHPAWKEIEEQGAHVSFRLETDTCLICQRPGVVSLLSRDTEKAGTPDSRRICLVTGNLEEPARLHTAIRGVWGAQVSGANIVSFNHDAFRSYGKEQGLNAPVGKYAEFAYTTALNSMLARGSRRRIQVGDASTVFWAERKNELEGVFAELFGEPSKEDPRQANRAIRILYDPPQAGAPPIIEDRTPFYVLGLAPNAARLVVRFWHASTVGETARHIRQHFDDCALAHDGLSQPVPPSLFRLLVSTSLLGKPESIPANIAGEFMKAILANTSYPQALLGTILQRCRTESEITYPRATLLKAVLVRSARVNQQPEREVGMALDTANKNIGYRLGRLFATLEKIQQEANPGINTTIRDRYYGSASGIPAAVFPHLMKLKNHHLSKLASRGRAVNLEKIISEIMEGINDFPTNLMLQDQARFAVGYYHQRQAFYTKKETN